MQPRAPVSMTTRSNFEIERAVDSVRETRAGYSAGQFQTDGTMSTPRHTGPNRFSPASRKRRRAVLCGSRRPPPPGSTSGLLSLNLPDKHATLSGEKCSLQPHPGSCSPKPTPLPTRFSALLVSLKWNMWFKTKFNLKQSCSPVFHDEILS